MLLEKKEYNLHEVDRFETEIIRASREFITASVPKLLREILGLKGVIGHPGPKYVCMYVCMYVCVYVNTALPDMTIYNFFSTRIEILLI